MKQKKVLLFLGIALVVIVAVAGWLVVAKPFTDTAKTGNDAPAQQQNAGTGKRICPEAWYDNKMPRPAEDASSSSQYFIVNGERVELRELDVEWVKANCSVNKPEVVY